MTARAAPDSQTVRGPDLLSGRKMRLPLIQQKVRSVCLYHRAACPAGRAAGNEVGGRIVETSLATNTATNAAMRCRLVPRACSTRG